jgi:hypothetical protein
LATKTFLTSLAARRESESGPCQKTRQTARSAAAAERKKRKKKKKKKKRKKKKAEETKINKLQKKKKKKRKKNSGKGLCFLENNKKPPLPLSRRRGGDTRQIWRSNSTAGVSACTR